MSKLQQVQEVANLVNEAIRIIDSTATPRMKLYLVESMYIGDYASERGMVIGIKRETKMTRNAQMEILTIREVLSQFIEDLGDLI